MCVCYDTVSGWGWNAKGLKWIGVDDDSATRGVRCCVCVGVLNHSSPVTGTLSLSQSVTLLSIDIQLSL